MKKNGTLPAPLHVPPPILDAPPEAPLAQILLTQISEKQWSIEASENVALMAVPTLLRLQANILEHGLTKAG